jgi:hypothetical protein
MHCRYKGIVILSTQMLGLLLYAACIYFSSLFIAYVTGRRICKSIYLVIRRRINIDSCDDRSHPIVDTEPTHDKVDGESETDDSDTDIDTDIYCDKNEVNLCEDIPSGRQIFPRALQPSEYKCKDI